jgi:hypothetical protein
MIPEFCRAAGHVSSRITSPAKLLKSIMLTGLFMVVSANAVAFEIVEWRFQTSLYTRHWSPNPEHNNHQKLLNIEFETASRWLYGFAQFENSYEQPSQYLYVGRSWPLFGRDWPYFKLTGGFIHGYKGDFKDKIPLIDLGIAPAIVPAFGLQYKRAFTELQILGNSAITVTAGFSFGYKSD